MNSLVYFIITRGKNDAYYVFTEGEKVEKSHLFE